MTKRFKGSNAKVVVAVNFDDQAGPLVKSAAALCRRTGMALRLVHVAEPWLASGWSSVVAGEVAMAEIVQSVQDENRRSAESKLFEIASSVEKGISVTTNVLTGSTIELLIADATAHGGAIIIAGASQGSHRFLPRGFSTALGLMGGAPMPVMVVGAGCTVDLSKERLRIAVADDLRDTTEGAVLAAFDLASALGKSDLRQIHVNGLTVDTLKTTLEAALAVSHSSIDPAVSAADIFAMAQTHLEERLRQRSQNRRELVEAAGGRCDVKLVSGPVQEELTKALEEFGADVVVFGRHHTFHRKPFLVGQMPFHAMLSQKRVVVVAPAPYQ